MLSQLVVGVFHAFCVTPLGEESWKLVPGFSQTSPPAPFPFADFVLYLHCNNSQKWVQFYAEFCEFSQQTVKPWVVLSPLCCCLQFSFSFEPPPLRFSFVSPWDPLVALSKGHFYLSAAFGSSHYFLPFELLLSFVSRTAPRPGSPPTSLACPFHSSLLDVVLLPKFSLRGDF